MKQLKWQIQSVFETENWIKSYVDDFPSFTYLCLMKEYALNLHIRPNYCSITSLILSKLFISLH